MTDLTEFLLARIAEDEAVARNARGPKWIPGAFVQDGRQLWSVQADPRPLVARVESESDVVHIARWDPARVLAECEAKRRIVEIESRWRRTKDNVSSSARPGFDGLTRVTWADESGRPHEETVTALDFRARFTEPSPPSETLRLLALPYADHPDYREEWRP